MPEPRAAFGRRRTLTNKAAAAQPAQPSATARTRALAALAADDGATEHERARAVDRVQSATAATSATAGWEGFDKVAEEMSDYAAFLKITEDLQIVKIIDASPVDVFVCHWIDEIEEGSKSIRCRGKAGCPLCDVGDKARKFSACFNVITLEDPADPALKLWECGVKVARQLKEIAEDEKKGPLDRPDLYFSVRKTQKSQKNVEYHVERVRSRDLEEEYGIKPLTENEISRFLSERYTDQIKEVLEEDAMNEIVALIMGTE